MKKLDIEFIKKWTNYSEEELMEKLVKDAYSLQEEAEKNKLSEEIKERKQDEEYPVYVEMFFDCKDYLLQYFSMQEIIDACAIHMSKRDLGREITIRGHRETYPGGIFKKHTTATFKEYRGRWEREVRDNGTVFIAKNPYQGVSGGHEVVKELLLQKCPWLQEYTVQIYDVSERNDWIYIDLKSNIDSCAAKSLYVPFSALMNKDAENIIKTHQDYWHRYGNGKYDEDTKQFIESSEVREFLKKVSM